MKKILFLTSVFAALTVMLSSCNMDLRPPGTLEPDNALQSPEDAANIRMGLYASFRGTVGTIFATADEIRSDLYHATAGFGNNGGDLYYYSFTSANGTAQSIWAVCYSNIANINFFIDKATTVNTEEWSDADKAALDLYVGEAYFLRAYNHYELAKNFCLDYVVGGEDAMGIPYITKYNPSSDNSTYPGRGTLKATYDNIIADLDVAAQKVTTPGTVGSAYITADVVTALRARVAMAMGDYAGVISTITSSGILGRYPLTTTEAEFKNMWIQDSGSECVLQLAASLPSELPYSYDFGYISWNYDKDWYQPQYIPEQWVVDLFNENPADFRTLNHITYRTVKMSGTDFDLYQFTKFPGNPALRSSEADQNYLHKPKVFRVAELYLLLAEAYALTGDNGNAATTLNQLRSARIPGFAAPAGEDIQGAIRDERVRELIGEGFRINDYKRYQRLDASIAITRGAAQIPEAIYLPAEHQSYSVAVSNFRIIFPIPQYEIDANPHMVQNEGYGSN